MKNNIVLKLRVMSAFGTLQDLTCFAYHQATESSNHKPQRGHSMMDRRAFATLLAGSIGARRLLWGQGAGTKRKTVLYSSVGGDLTLYSMDIDDATLGK